MTIRMPSAFSAASASGVDGLTGSAMAMAPATRRSMPTKITVAPSRRRSSAASASGAASAPCSAMNLAFPSITR
jgi:hypothetical protein